jgi:hypothetical protein
MAIVWLNTIAVISLTIAVVCCVWLIVDVFRGHRQKMMVMNFIWPITALYAGILGIWAYYRFGRANSS